MIKKYNVQSVGLSTMKIDADNLEITNVGVKLIKNNDVIFFAPHSDLKYVCIDDCVSYQHKK